jgi:NADPH:quinone reductase-like Zn-dependent oxidoreductase
MEAIQAVRIHRFGGIDALKVEAIEPSMPDAREVMVAVRAASVNPVDFKIRSGHYPAVKGDKLPYTLGRDIAGVVVACGAGATCYKAGDEVFGMVGIHGGGYAEKVLIDEDALAPTPNVLDYVHAASVPLAGLTAWQGLFRHGKLTAGQRILIHGGAGGVGHFAVQFAKARGAHVATTVSTEHVEFARSLGADVVIDYKKQNFETMVESLDMVFDLIDGETRERSWPLLKKGSVLVSTLTEPSAEKARMHGVRGCRFTVEADGAELAEIARLIDAGRVRPVVEKTFPLAAAAEALAAVENGHSQGKIVLTVN